MVMMICVSSDLVILFLGNGSSLLRGGRRARLLVAIGTLMDTG